MMAKKGRNLQQWVTQGRICIGRQPWHSHAQNPQQWVTQGRICIGPQTWHSHARNSKWDHTAVAPKLEAWKRPEHSPATETGDRLSVG